MFPDTVCSALGSYCSEVDDYFFWTAQRSSTECESMQSEVLRLNENINDYVLTAFQSIYETGNSLVVFDTTMQDLNEDLKTIQDVLDFMYNLLRTLSLLDRPTGCNCITPFKTRFENLRNHTVDPLHDKVGYYNHWSETSDFAGDIESVQEVVEDASEVLVEAQVILSQYFAASLVAVDSFYQTDAVKSICDETATILDPISDTAEKYGPTVVTVATNIETVAETMAFLNKVVNSNEWQTAVYFFENIDTILDPFSDFLDISVNIHVPFPQYCFKHVCKKVKNPCGTRKCSRRYACGKRCRRKGRRFRCDTKYCTSTYPCGVKWCWERVCTRVKYPCGVKIVPYSYTVDEIISGALSLNDFLWAYVDEGMEAAWDTLGLGPPSLNMLWPFFPDIPDFSKLTISLDDFGLEEPDLPELPFDVPSSYGVTDDATDDADDADDGSSSVFQCDS